MTVLLIITCWAYLFSDLSVFCLLLIFALSGDIFLLGYISCIFKFDNWFFKKFADWSTFGLIWGQASSHAFPLMAISLKYVLLLEDILNIENESLFKPLSFFIGIFILELLIIKVPLLIYRIISRAKQQRAKHLSTKIELLDKNLSDCEIRLENRKNILHLLPLLASCGGAVDPIYADSRISSDRALAQQITALKQKITHLWEKEMILEHKGAGTTWERTFRIRGKVCYHLEIYLPRKGKKQSARLIAKGN